MKLEVIEFKDLTDEKLNEMIDNKVSFHIRGIGSLLDQTAKELDRKITAHGFKTRVYVSKRLTFVLIAGALMPVVGVSLALAASIHNVCTVNPDFEISKYIWDKEIVVTYKKYNKEFKAELKKSKKIKKAEIEKKAGIAVALGSAINIAK